MYYVYFVSLITVHVKSQDCSSGTFGWHNNKCMFECDSDTTADVYVDPSTLSFDAIADSCDGVRYAKLFGLCSTLDDLSWPDADTSCHCPLCACSTPKESFMATSTRIESKKSCFNCTCVPDTPSVYQCEKQYSMYFESPYKWNDFTCQDPPILCNDTASGYKYRTGESWFSHVDTFCYCKANGQPVCEQGFNAILNSDHQPLVNAFYDGCSDKIRDCINDASRMVPSTGIGNRAYYCPNCNCGSHAAGDVWYGEYAPNHVTSVRQCYQCECHNETTRCSDTYNNENPEIYPVDSGYTCPEPNTISCHYEASSPSDYAETAIPSTISPQSLQPKLYGTNAPEAWCGWQYTHVDNTTRSDTDGTNWSWGSGLIPFCSIYGMNDACFYVRYPEAFCSAPTKWQTTYHYCCNDNDNCNWKDINIDNCTESAEASAIMQNMQKCLSIYSCTMEDEYKIPCSEMEKEIEGTVGCTCESFVTSYEDAPGAYKPWFESYVTAFLDQMRVQAWNDVTGCNVDVQCDLTNGSEIDGINPFVIIGGCITTTLLVLGVVYYGCKKSRRRPYKKEDGLIQSGQQGDPERIALDNVIEDHLEEDVMSKEELSKDEEEGENQQIVGTSAEIDIAPVQSD